MLWNRYNQRMLKIGKWLGLLLLWLSVMPALSMLQLELTQGVSSAVPIAITPFTGTSVTAPGDETIDQIVSNDLQNSGEFRVVGPQNIVAPATPVNINYSYWQQQKIDNLVVGHITTKFGGRYTVNFELVSTYKGAQHNNILMQDSFTASGSGLRELAHHISDLIYTKLTGTPGIFNTKIAYVLVQRAPNKPTQYKLELSDVDGFNPQTLLSSAQPIMSPAWSPDGSKLAYVSFENHRAAIFVQSLASGQRQEVSDAPGINGAPAWSPDGEKLALVLSKTGNPNIYILNLASRQLRAITQDWSIDTEPSFSPDGKYLLFTSNRDGTPQIYRYTFASGNTDRITFTGNYNARATFMPDEQGIVMMHRQDGMFGIAKQDLQDGRVWVLTQAGQDESPSLAPNGKMVIYATQYGGRGVLAQVSTNGQVKLRLPAREGAVQDPAWSPFLHG